MVVKSEFVEKQMKKNKIPIVIFQQIYKAICKIDETKNINLYNTTDWKTNIKN